MTRIEFRFILPLALVLGGLCWGVAAVGNAVMTRRFQASLDARSERAVAAIEAAVAKPPMTPTATALDVLFDHVAAREQFLALAWCTPQQQVAGRSADWPRNRVCPPASSTPVVENSQAGPILMASATLHGPDNDLGRLVVLQGLGKGAAMAQQKDSFFNRLLALLSFGGVPLTLGRSPFKRLRWNRTTPTPAVPRVGGKDDKGSWLTIAPLVQEMRSLFRTFDLSRAPSPTGRVDWTPESLRSVLHHELPGAEVLVVSNREPYIHNLEGDQVVLQRPASGLVTAMEPIMRSCGGTWIAHGSGTADRMTVDAQDRLAVPPGAPTYSLRRVWLSEEEQEGYYYGFANEGLWPLCHIAFVRPTFRTADWEQYVAVNRKFADAVIAEAQTPNPIVLVQDYHFALLPRMVREALPDATIITFWHIPWPNPEVFSICPWKEEILTGLLGSSILGFHIQFHCLNFLDSVDRFLESHIDREHSIVRAGDNATLVRPYPISIEWPPTALASQPSIKDCRDTVRRRYNLAEDALLAVGVERFDYTKGIADRFRAVESLLTAHPEWLGRFTLLQIAAPTRGSLAAYRETQEEAQSIAQAVNDRFGADHGAPIILVAKLHDPEAVFTLFRAADLCLVSSLHDGMNLVAKEFVAARDDADGVLLLSTFAGASRELREALIVNPYDHHAMGEAIHAALTMPAQHRRERMLLMREMVSENNIYCWAGQMLLDAARMRKRRHVERQIAALSPDTAPGP